MVFPRKANVPVLRENMNKKDEKNVPFYSRIGSSSKVISTKVIRIGSMDNNTKVARPPICSSSNGKEIVGSSSRTVGGFGYLRKLAKGTGRRRLSSNLDTDSSETSSIHDDPTATEPLLRRQKTKISTINVHSRNTASGEVIMSKAGSSSRGTSRSSHQKYDLGNRDALMGLSVSSYSDSECTVRGGLSRLRNSRYNSVSDAVPPNSSSAKKISVIKTKNSDGESSSSSKGNKTSVSVLKGKSQSSSHGNGITVSDNRRNQIIPTINDNNAVSTVRRSSYFGRSGRIGVVSSPATSLQTPRFATPTDPNPSLSFVPSNSFRRPNSSIGRLRSMIPSSPSEADPSRSLVNRGGLSRYNMNGIAEVLLALERIEHDQEITHDLLTSLENNLLSSGVIRIYDDQHRDMRLNIDNMSYEELLALGDKIGTVKTALSDEALSRSLKKSIYKATDETRTIYGNKDDDIKCSICQEEYVDGDEVGNMPCEHMYHVSCVQQWLRIKNWCPICKTSVKMDKSF